MLEDEGPKVRDLCNNGCAPFENWPTKNVVMVDCPGALRQLAGSDGGELMVILTGLGISSGQVFIDVCKVPKSHRERFFYWLSHISLP